MTIKFKSKNFNTLFLFMVFMTLSSFFISTASAGKSCTVSEEPIVSEEPLVNDPPPLPLGEIPITQEHIGYTQVIPSADTMTIYVSSSAGDDSNNGEDPEYPVKSLKHAISLLRSGYPDWLVLKAGDTWTEGLGQWKKSGRSPSEPMVITSYGAGSDRPLLLTNQAIYTNGGGKSPESMDNIVISGLHFYAHERDPESSSYNSGTGALNAVNWLRGTTSLVIEDNVFQSYKTGISIYDYDKLGISNVALRRNVIIDSYSTRSHSQGLYVHGADGILIEENILDHNGWNANISGAEKTIFNHGIYIQNGNINVNIKNNIIMRSSSHGVQLRPGGILNGNLLIQNAVSLLMGGGTGPEDGGVNGNVSNNIILHGTDIADNQPRGWGIDLDNINNVVVSNNIVANILTSYRYSFAIRKDSGAELAGNMKYSWGKNTADNVENYKEPQRAIEDYDLKMGGDGTFDSFAEKLRSQSLRNWDEGYSIKNIKDFFVDGFMVNQL